jgi:hypothetical protein
VDLPEVPPRHLTPLAEETHNELRALWSTLCEEEAETHGTVLSAMRQTLREHREFGLLSERDESAFDNLLSSSASRELLQELSEIAVLFKQCAAAKNANYASLSTEWALRNLIVDSRARPHVIAGGRIVLRDRAAARNFWLHHIFEKAESEIWTTNTSRPGESLGNTPDDGVLLRTQAEAIARHVKVTRMFVYDPGMPRDEVLQRKSLMREQLERGIRVLVITAADFSSLTRQFNARRTPTAEDFMLIDGQFLYLTRPEEDGLEAELLDGLTRPPMLEFALEFKEALLTEADEVTADNLEQFPNIALMP